MTISAKPLNAGDRFGQITLVSIVESPRRGTFWLCRCDCGNEVVKYAGHIRAGQAKSCGCVKGAHRTHQMSGSSEYRAWDNARSRCYRENDRKYPTYGGRGVRMCEAWRQSFEAFIADMGKKPTSLHTLDRINNDGNYEPSNCRWATRTEQNNNRSFNRHLMLNGELLTVAQAARAVGLPHATILHRLDAGKSDEEAVRHE